MPCIFRPIIPYPVSTQCNIYKRKDLSNDSLIKELKSENIYINSEFNRPDQECACNSCYRKIIPNYRSYRDLIANQISKNKIQWNNLIVNTCTANKCICRKQICFKGCDGKKVPNSCK